MRDEPGVVLAAQNMLKVFILRLAVVDAVGLIIIHSLRGGVVLSREDHLRPLERGRAQRQIHGRRITRFAHAAHRHPRRDLGRLHEQPIHFADYAETLHIIDQQAQRMVASSTSC